MIEAPLRLLRDNIQRIATDSEHLVLAAMVLLLHGALWSNWGSAMSRALMLVHLGLFLIWQPIWQRDRRLDATTALTFGALTAAAIAWLSWWLVFAWLVLLIGLVGGRTLTLRNARSAYFLTLVMLVSELIIRCVPALFDVKPLPGGVVALFRFGLLLVPMSIALLRFRTESSNVDFFRGLAVALVAAMVAIGSLLNMYDRGVAYPLALAQSLLALAAFLFLLSWLLSPHRGFTGFTQLWERSLLNIGTPFEAWLAELARLAGRQQTPARFIEAAMQALTTLPWVHAAAWETAESDGVIGTPTIHQIELRLPELQLYLYTRRSVGPTLLLHCRLLLQLLGHFYLAKVRERELAQQAQLQAIYETGARVTHDIKNLLQSLSTMAAALERDRPTPPFEAGERRRKGQRAQRLFERQLPHLTQRLQRALEKLQAPQSGVAEESAVSLWWRALQARMESVPITREERLRSDPSIPVELFDSVVENLVENARLKQTLDPDVRITVRILATDDELVLQVEDSGAPVPAEKAEQLCRQPVESDYGLGIGLYQAARQAEVAGYALTLVRNDPGSVVFELRRTSHPPEASQFPLFGSNAPG
ncbi:MAG: sensor histidine kinase [Gammaproteobacteria bacterium]|nr:sensor histidine kinase [Gammaproteobacteria bacterium]